MDQSEFFLGKFDLTWQLKDETFYLSVFPEMLPCFPIGIKPSGGYAIYCVHPQYGSCFFSITQDEECQWICEHRPSWIKMELVNWISEQIESRTR